METILPDFQSEEEQLKRAKDYAINNIVREDNVLSHGDFKPDNMLVADEEPLAVIDWPEFGVAVRQLDLGSVLLFLDESCGDAFIEQYLKKTGIHTDKKALKKTSLVVAGLIHSDAAYNLHKKYPRSSEWRKHKEEMYVRLNKIINLF